MKPKAIVVDTNVLIHDPESIETLMNDVNILFLHNIVIQELDRNKGKRDIGHDCREAIRWIEKLQTEKHPRLKIVQQSDWTNPELSHLFRSEPDHQILALAHNLTNNHPEDYQEVKLISKDTTVRILAREIGVHVEDYVSSSVMIGDVKMKEVEVPSSIITQVGEGRFLFSLKNMEDFNENEGVVCWSDWNGELALNGSTSRWNKWFTAIKKGDVFEIIPNNISAMGLTSYSMSGEPNWSQYVALKQLLDPQIKLSFLIGGAGTGKAQPLDAKVLTPDGWVLMGDIKSGDVVLTPDGGRANVTSIHPQGIKNVYRISFNDGSSTECCEDHLWTTKTLYDKKMGYDWSVKDTKSIMDTISTGKKSRRNHCIPMISDAGYNEKSITIDPYLLGVMIGDGGMTGHPNISSVDDDIIANINIILSDDDMILSHSDRCTYNIIHKTKPTWNAGGNHLKNMLVDMGLWGHKSYTKFIPQEYIHNTKDIRIGVLQGIMDTDGTIDKRSGCVSYCTVSNVLADNVRELIMSLGGKATIKSKHTTYTYKGVKKSGADAYIIHISLPNDIKPFRLSRKLKYVKIHHKYPPSRMIDDVSYVGDKECQCIFIDSVDHLYITDDYIVTHNTILALAAALEQRRMFRNILVTRPMVHLEDEDRMGFLPGSIEDKMSPWLRPIWRSLSFIGQFEDGNEKIIQNIRDKSKLEIEPLDYIRGMTFVKDVLIIDEAQNLTPHQIKTIITRAGEHCKMIFTGDLGQIDRTRKVDATSNGLSYASVRMANQPMVSVCHFKDTVRSPLAHLAERLL